MKINFNKKPSFKKVLTLVAVLAIFIGYLQYNAYQQTHFQVNSKVFSSVGNWDSYIQKESNNFPGLSLANRYHLLQSVNHTINLANSNRDINIEKVWLTGGKIYLVYSVNINKTDKRLGDIPNLKIKSMILNAQDGKSFPVTLNIQNQYKYSNSTSDELQWTTASSHAINHRVYRILNMNYHINPTKIKSYQALNQEFSKVKTVTLQGISFKTQDNKTNINIQDFKIPVNYTDQYKLLQNIPLNKTVTIDQGIQMQLQSANIYLYETSINYKLVTDKNNISRINLHFQEKPQYKNMPVGSTFTQSRSHSLFLTPVTGIPTVYTLTPDSYLYQVNATFTATITKQQIQQAVKNQGMNNNNGIKIGKFSGMTIYFGVLAYSKYDSIGALYLRFKTDQPMANSNMINTIQNIHLVKQNGQNNFSPTGVLSRLRILNRAGQDFKTTNHGVVISSDVSSVVKQYSINIQELDSAKAMTFKISNILKQKPINNAASFKITIPKP